MERLCITGSQFGTIPITSQEPVAEMDGGVAAGQVAGGFAQVEAQPPTAGRSRLPGGGP